MEIKFRTNCSDETIALGKKIGHLLEERDVVLLTGDLSAGKTTFTKGLGLGLGVIRVINSPTFTIVKEYQGSNTKLYHLDLYRLDGLNSDFDLEEYFDSDGVVVIEWPYQVEELIPSNYLEITIKRLDENKREFCITSKGNRYDKIVEELSLC